MTPRPIHPFPARMAASIPWTILEAKVGSNPLHVLDPMAGSGTTVVTARTLGHHAVGFDTDPLAVLIASTWCANVNPTAVTEAAASVVNRCRDWRRIRSRDAYPLDADEQTRAYTRYWFDLTNRKQLAALSQAITAIRPPAVRRMLWCAFSRLIIVKQAGASLAMDVSHSRPHRTFDVAPIRPLAHFERAVRKMIDAAPFCGARRREPKAHIRVGDARKLPIDSGTIDLVITSPPYLNAIDYMRGHRLSLVWMQHSLDELRTIRSANIGTEAGRSDKATDPDLLRAFRAGVGTRHLSSADQGMFTRYLRDIRQVLHETRRVLRAGGLAVLVVGDCNIRGTFVKNSNAIKALAVNQQFRLEGERRRVLPRNRRYLPPPEAKDSGSDLARRLRKEVVLTFVAQ